MTVLIRKDDGLSHKGLVEFVEFDDKGFGKGIHMKPQVGFACIVNRMLMFQDWMTSPIVEVISDTEFKTMNSHYVIEEF